MTDSVRSHYGGGTEGLASRIRDSLLSAGKDPANLTTADLASVDEFHVRGRKATFELGERLELREDAHVLDIGSGLGGPARALAQNYGCRVTGVDLAEAFCEAARELSRWVALDDRVRFESADATALPFADDTFDAAVTIHAAMNIPAKDAVYAEAKRVLKPRGVFAIYDVLAGEGGDVVFPVPWARDPSISHLATPTRMRELLAAAEFEIVHEHDSTTESLAWFREMTARIEKHGPPPVTFDLFLGDDFPTMARNQVRNLAEDRIRTVTYVCRA